MKTSLDCIPCLVRQSLRVARMASSDEKVHEAILREILRHASQLDLARPPMLGQWIYRQVRQRTGQADPYLSVKQESNRLALALYPAWKQRVLASENPLIAAVRLAIAANIIDFGIITVAVKGGPAINDALRVDAEAAGLLGLVEVIDNGTDGAGTLLETCSAEFQQRFERAHLIIAKGQANFETLDDCPREIFFLLKVKCPLVGRHIGREVGSLVIHRNRPAAQANARGARACPAGKDKILN